MHARAALFRAAEEKRMSHLSSRDPLTWLYPPIEPYRTGTLKVSGLHEIYFEECGNPEGKPVVYLHGGPGGGGSPKPRRFFRPPQVPDRGLRPAWVRTQHPQRLPGGEHHLGPGGRHREAADAPRIERWQVFGGSWGSNLALAYAERHPERVSELVLRGIFHAAGQGTGRFYQEGASIVYPDAWEGYWAHNPRKRSAHDMIRAYHARLTSEDPEVRLAAARSGADGGRDRQAHPGSGPRQLPRRGTPSRWPRPDRVPLLREPRVPGLGRPAPEGHRGRIRHIPGVIIQGRYDMCCPIMSAWDLHKAWPEADFIITPDAGHSAWDAPNTRALVAATDRFAARG